MVIKLKNLLISILIPLAVGGLSSFIVRGSFSLFSQVNKPPISPPSILFPIVWTILYILMGIASYIVYENSKNKKNNGLTFYAIQLIFNFVWPILFFNYNLYLVSFIWLFILWILILITTIKFYNVNKIAGYLMIPYLVWVFFAGYLNLGIYLLN